MRQRGLKFNFTSKCHLTGGRIGEFSNEPVRRSWLGLRLPVNPGLGLINGDILLKAQGLAQSDTKRLDQLSRLSFFIRNMIITRMEEILSLNSS